MGYKEWSKGGKAQSSMDTEYLTHDSFFLNPSAVVDRERYLKILDGKIEKTPGIPKETSNELISGLVFYFCHLIGFSSPNNTFWAYQ